MFEIIRPSEGKVFTNADETETYTALILAPNDSLNNYHEVDIPEEQSKLEEEMPDPEDENPEIPEAVDGEETITPMTRAELTAKVLALEDELVFAKILLGVSVE